jgi:hypothetical protein
MGRPLNKRYFGNENTNDTGDNASNFGELDAQGNAGYTAGEGIGGDSVASVTITAAGTYTSALPTVAFSDPNLAGVGGVTATGTVHGKALTAVATAAGTGYNLADSLVQNNGGTGTFATWNVTGLKVVGITLNNGGTANDVNDEFDFSVAGFATALRVRVTASSGGNATAVEIVNGGVWTAGALPATTIGMTRTQVVAGQDMNGQGLQVNITAWGVATVAVATEGDYTAVTSGAKATTATPAGGTGATLTITYGVKSVEITDPGSGYTTVADAAPTFSSGAATGTSVLTVDSGTPYTRDAFNTLIVTAYLPEAHTDGWISGAGGSSPVIGDILKQSNQTRYKVITAQGVGLCLLKTNNASTGAAEGAVNPGEMTIKATDSLGKTYYVKKLTSRKVAIVPYGATGHVFPLLDNGEPQSVHWTLTTDTNVDPTYDAENSVVLENA